MQVQILKQPFEINFSGNDLIYALALTPYGFIEKKQDIKIAIAIQKENAPGIYFDIKNDIFYPDADGKLSINISSYADAYLEFYKPRFTQIQPFKISGQSSKFRIKILLQKNGVQVGDIIFTQNVIVIKGGLAYEQYDYRLFFEGLIINNKMALHFRQAYEQLTFSAKKFITWLYPLVNTTPAVPNPQKVICTFWDVDNNENTIEIPVPFNANKWDIFCFDCSLNNVLANYNTSDELRLKIFNYNIVSYSVYVVGVNNEIIIEPTYFKIDYRNHFSMQKNAISALLNYIPYYNPQARNIIYSNSIGGLETLELLGEIEMQAEYKTTNAQVTTPPSGIANALLAAQVVNTETLQVEKFVGSTIFISQKKLLDLKDLLLSKFVLEVTNFKYLPILINKKTVKFYSTRDNIFSMQIEWQHAFENKFYTPSNLMDIDTYCPALENFTAIQIAKNKLQVLWAMPYPYDLIEVRINNGTDTFVYQLSGNSGSQIIEFVNPAAAPATASIIVTGKVICNPDTVPVSYGPALVVNIDAYANLAPVANADTFAIAAGYTTSQILPGSVLDNDYDFDNDAIEVVAASGATFAGGTFSVNALGKVTYTAPSALYNGVDSFNYTIREVALPSSTATALVNINVGNVGLGNGFYVKVIIRDHQEIGQIFNFIIVERVIIGFFSDPACTIAKDATGLGVSVNVRNRLRSINVATGNVFTDNSTTEVYNATGTEMEIFYGPTTITMNILNLYRDVRTFSLLPGAGYIPV